MTLRASGGAGRGTWVTCLAFAVAVFALAAAPRLVDIDAHLTPDELRWVCRTLNFHTAVRSGDWAGTVQTGHPGVFTMWLGGLGLPVDPTASWSVACSASASSELIYALPPADRDVLLERLMAGRRRVALFSALGIALSALAVGRLFGSRTAAAAAPMLALDPFYLAHSRVLHLDAVLTTNVLLCLLCLLVYREGQGRRAWLTGSGIALGAALVSKSPALYLMGFGLLYLMAAGLRDRRAPRSIAGDAGQWLATAVVTAGVLWPALWGASHVALDAYVADFARHGTAVLEDASFFAGAVRDDAGAGFYPLIVLLRASPLALLGLAMLGAMRGQARNARAAGVLVAFAVGFGLFLTLATKEFDRYLLPAFPMLDIAAAVGFAAAWSHVRRQQPPIGRERSTVALACATAALQALLVLPVHPYYGMWYDPLVGGAPLAVRTVLVGWGEGLDQAAAFLNARPDAERLTVASRYRAAFAPLLDGTNIQTQRFDPESTDYLAIMLNQVQRRQDPELLDRTLTARPPAIPAFVARAGGVDVAWLYQNMSVEAPAAYLAARADPERDVIVARADNLLVRGYDGDVPLIAVPPDADQPLVDRHLKPALRAGKGIWFVHNTDIAAIPVARRIQLVLATRGVLIESVPFGELTVDRYRVPAGTRAGDGRPRPCAVAFEGGPQLVALWVPAGPLTPGTAALVVTDWRVPGLTLASATLTLQLYDSAGVRVAQNDVPLATDDGTGVAMWEPDASMRTRQQLDLPPGLLAGTYRLRLGLYRLDDGRVNRFVPHPTETWPMIEGEDIVLEVTVGAPHR